MYINTSVTSHASHPFRVLPSPCWSPTSAITNEIHQPRRGRDAPDRASRVRLRTEQSPETERNQWQWGGSGCCCAGSPPKHGNGLDQDIS